MRRRSIVRQVHVKLLPWGTLIAYKPLANRTPRTSFEAQDSGCLDILAGMHLGALPLLVPADEPGMSPALQFLVSAHGPKASVSQMIPSPPLISPEPITDTGIAFRSMQGSALQSSLEG